MFMGSSNEKEEVTTESALEIKLPVAHKLYVFFSGPTRLRHVALVQEKGENFLGSTGLL